MVFRKRRSTRPYSSRKRYKRSGSFRRSRGPRFLARRRARVPPSLQPESKYVDSGYGFAYATANAIAPAGGAGTAVLDGNGPATVAADSNCGTPVLSAAVGIAGGAGFNQRIGRKIFLKYISVRTRIYFPPVVGGSRPTVQNAQRVRMVLVYDRQPNLTLPLASDVMNINPGMTIETFMEDRNRDRFVRLWDHTVQLSLNDPNVPSFNSDSQATINKMIKIGGIQVYNDTSLGGIANIQTGALVWVFMWDTLGGTVPPQIDLNTRLRYSDL